MGELKFERNKVILPHLKNFQYSKITTRENILEFKMFVELHLKMFLKFQNSGICEVFFYTHTSVV